MVTNEYVLPSVMMADFEGEIHVDYLDRQGIVVHLYPQLEDPDQHVIADPPHLFQPGEHISLGQPSPTNRGWQVVEPYGTDVILAVATADPLFDRPRPGHCPGNVLFYFAQVGAAFVGDALFNGSIGRTDLPGGNFAELEQSIRAQIYSLPGPTKVYPGHGPATTVAHEKANNPYVSD